jgi:transposase
MAADQPLQLLKGGERPSVVARILGVDRSSLYRWRQRAAEGAGALAAQPHPHRPPQLRTAQWQHLERLLAQGPQAHGWINALWTTDRVAQLIEHHFGIRYHHDHVGRFLRQRLGWSVQKPHRRARERNEAAIRDWRGPRDIVSSHCEKEK